MKIHVRTVMLTACSWHNSWIASRCCNLTPLPRDGSVYTVLEPAPGADGKECMVLTTTQNLSGSAEDMLDRPAFAGLSVSLSILKYLKDHVGWMSKRLIVLVADEDVEGAGTERLHLGVKSFVDDYHVDTLELLER